MFGLQILVKVQTFQRVPPVLPCNFCHPANISAYQLDSTNDADSKLWVTVRNADFFVGDGYDCNVVGDGDFVHVSSAPRNPL